MAIRSALMDALYFARFEIVKLLLESGADVNYRAEQEEGPQTALQAFMVSKSSQGMDDIIEPLQLLLLHGAKIEVEILEWDCFSTGLHHREATKAREIMGEIVSICGEMSRDGGFTEYNIGRYMKELREAIDEMVTPEEYLDWDFLDSDKEDEEDEEDEEGN